MGGRSIGGAAGAERGGVWEGVSPSPMRDGSGEGAVRAPPQKIFGLFFASEWCIVRAF